MPTLLLPATPTGFSGVEITAGSGTNVATDDVTGTQVLREKWVLGTLNSTTKVPGTASRGLCVEYRRPTKVAVGSFTTDTAAHAAKDTIATGSITTSRNDSLVPNKGGMIRSIVVTDLSRQMAELDILLFKGDPSGGSLNAVFDPTNSNAAKIFGAFHVFPADYYDFNDNCVAFLSVRCPFDAPFGYTYATLVARGTPTYASTSDIQVILGVERD